MKKQLMNPGLLLSAAIGAAFLTGCASMNQGGFSQGENAVSTLAFTPVTDPRELVKWSNDKFLQANLKTMDTYYFEESGSAYPINNSIDRGVSTSTYQESAGGPGAFQSSSGGGNVIRYRPNSTR